MPRQVENNNASKRHSALGWLSLKASRTTKIQSRWQKIATKVSNLPRQLLVFIALILLCAGGISISSNLSNSGGSNEITQVSALSSGSATVLPSKVMPKSLPVSLSIPAINLDTPLITTGQQSDGAIQMPVRYDVAAWYDKSPTPGERGPSIIAGHVDNWRGIGVFFRLKQLKYGDTFSVTRADGTTAHFTVLDVEEYSKEAFPSKEVYGGINYAGIRLITCGGTFNRQTGAYDDNIVVFGKLQ
jgi:LPXTG-site transpeptidase (sortase) family protein